MVQKISFEYVSYLELCQPLFRRSKTICAILIEGIMRNISVIYLKFGLVVQEKTSFTDVSGLEL